MYKITIGLVLLFSGIAASLLSVFIATAVFNTYTESQPGEVDVPPIFWAAFIILVGLAWWWIWSGVSILKTRPRPSAKFIKLGAIVGSTLVLVLVFIISSGHANLIIFVPLVTIITISTFAFLLWPPTSSSE